MARSGQQKLACSSGDANGRECICTVCTCGCHKCPQKHTSVYTEYGDITSEYGAKYPEWPMPQKFTSQRILPTLRPSTAPMASTTTYRETYINHPLSPPRSASCRPAPQPRPCQKETDYRTTYHMNYWDKSAQMCTPQAQAPQAQHCTSGNKQFEGQSMYQLQFPNHGPQPRCVKQPVSRPAAGSLNTVKSRQKFDCDSTYHDDYRQWALPAKCVHKRECSPPPARNECGPTTYQSDYVDRHALRPCPVLSRAKPTDVCGDHMCY